jgi:hypothetical protein
MHGQPCPIPKPTVGSIQSPRETSPHDGYRDTKNHAGQRNAMHVQLCTVLVLVLYLLECALETASLNTAVAEPLDAVQLAELGAIGRTVTAL